MIDINDKDFKLLKMTESLLSRVDDDRLREDALDRYAILSKKIDEKSFQELVRRIKEYKHNQTLEEELDELEEIDNSYIQLEEAQYKFKNIYKMYSDKELSLSELDEIDIEKIRDRKNLALGYLVNKKNIQELKKQLEGWNEQLINEDKKRANARDKFKRLEDELRKSFVNAEGRKETVSAYTSVRNEYEDNGMDLNKLIQDKEFMDETYRTITSRRQEKEELLETGKICYESNPSKENKEILDNLRMEAVKVRYQLSLIKIARLIASEMDEYDKLIDKREQLLDLIKKRVSYLGTLGKKFVVDPFGRVKIQEQLGYIETSLEDNSKIIMRIRKSINEGSNRLEELINDNSTFLSELNAQDMEFICDKKRFGDIDTSFVDIFDTKDDNDDEKIVLDNQVVSVRDTSQEFRTNIVREKTSGVIRRVYEMVMNEEIPDSKLEEAPQLVMEEVDNDIENKLDDKTTQPADDMFELDDISSDTYDSDKHDGIISSGSFVDEIFNDWNKGQEDTSFVNKDNLDIKEEKPIVSIPHEYLDKINDQSLFENNEGNPFESIKLFDDKASNSLDKTKGNRENMSMEDVVSLKDNKDDSTSFKLDSFPQVESQELEDEGMEKLENELPDAFWITNSNSSPAEDNVTKIDSIDEQVKKLRLVA